MCNQMHSKLKLKNKSIDQLIAMCSNNNEYARTMKVNEGDFSLSGSGRLIVNVSDRLKAQITGFGNIRYEGKPSTRVEIKVIGSGTVREIKNH